MTERAPRPKQREGNQPRDAAYWARRVETLKVSDVPEGVPNNNVEGRRVVGPLQGFGKMWQKTYKVRLAGAEVSPAEVIKTWKENYQGFWPEGNKFYAPLSGIAPGEVALISGAAPRGLKLSTGVMVLYSDDESFSLMTAEGLPEAGWNTFSAYEDEDGTTVAQVQSLARASDPIYEVGFRLFGSTEQERIWTHVLTSLAARFGVNERVQLEKVCVDTNLQWSRIGNVWHNTGARSMIYTMAAPARLVLGLMRRRTR
jgi:hypothetical protein